MRSSVKRLDPDGFLLAADAGGVRIIGQNPIGVLYGVYDLLRTRAGLRWFAPGAGFEHCPQRPTVSVPDQVTLSNPAFPIRRWWPVCANVNSKTLDSWDWLVRNGMTLQAGKRLFAEHGAELEKRGAVLMDGGNNFYALLSDSLFEEHPEYFGLIGGRRVKQEYKRQPCTSHPRVAVLMAASLKAWHARPPAALTYLVGNNDDTLWCRCPRCEALDPPDEKAKRFVGTRYYTFVNAVAADVCRAHPEAELWSYAYQNFQYPPTGVTPDPRLFIQAAIHGRCYQHSLADLGCRINDRFRALLDQWGRLPNTVSTLEFIDATCLPNYLPLERVLAEDIRYYRRIGLAGCTFFAIPPDGTFGPRFEAPRFRDSLPAQWQAQYLAARLLWDPEADVEALLEDMGETYYGPAWPAMRRYRAALTGAFEGTPGHMYYGQSPVGKLLEKPGLEAALTGLLDEAAALTAGNPGAAARVALDRAWLRDYWQAPHRVYTARRPRELRAVRRQAGLLVDGRFDEPDWGRAEFTGHFIDLGGRTPADPQSFVKLLYDETNLYLAIEAMEPEPGRMQAAVTERDGPLWEDSSLELFVHAPGLGERYVHLMVNPRGAIYDALALSSGDADMTFDARMDAAVRMLDDRWVAEIRLPSDALGCAIQEGDTWKLNVARTRQLTGAPAQRSSWSHGAFHGVDAWRSVVLGETALLQNGDFEDVVEPSPAAPAAAGHPGVPAQWVCEAPESVKVFEDGAASGRRFVRVADSRIFQKVNQPAEFRGVLRIGAKARGHGALTVAMYRYERDTGKNLPTVVLKTFPLEAAEWSGVEAAYACADDAVLRLAFHADGRLDLDDVTVTRPAAGCPAP